MIRRVGILRTSAFTNISRSTLWRWKRFGIDPKRRIFESKLFESNKDLLRSFLLSNQCTTAIGIIAFFRSTHNVKLSAKTVYRFIKLIGFTRKRTKLRGQCKGDLMPLVQVFCSKYRDIVKSGKTIVSVDECGFSKRLKPNYGYSPIGEPVLVKTNGGWVHHSLLMAVFSDGRKTFVVKKGSINKQCFTSFIESLGLDEQSVVVMDNASIHKNLPLEGRVNISYTPPYSPEFNAIELCFAKIKRDFRRMNHYNDNRNVPDLISEAVDLLTNQTITACFEHVWKSFVQRQNNVQAKVNLRHLRWNAFPSLTTVPWKRVCLKWGWSFLGSIQEGPTWPP